MEKRRDINNQKIIENRKVFGKKCGKGLILSACLWQDKSTYNCNAKVHNLAISVE